MSQLKLSNLDDHNCLVGILENLDILELLTVAQTSNAMKVAAQLTFRRKYGSSLNLYIISYGSHRNTGYQYQLTQNEIVSRDTRFLLQFVRYFGQFISELLIKFRICHSNCCNTSLEARGMFTGKMKTFFNYVNEYCSDSLKKLIYITDCEALMTFTGTKKPFLNLEELHVHNWTTPKDRFKLLFPKLRHLTYESKDLRCIEQHFPELITLKLNPFICPLKTTLEGNIMETFRLNPQLRGLNMYLMEPWNAELMRSVAKLLPSLNCLEVDGYFRHSDSPPAHNHVHFDSVRTFKYDIGVYNEMTFTFENLKEFVCINSALNMRDRKIYSIINKNRSITKLSAGKKFFDDPHVLQTILPSLQEINIIKAPLTASEAVFLLTEIQTVKKMEFVLQCETLTELNEFCGEKWRIEENGTFLRKKCIKLERIQ